MPWSIMGRHGRHTRSHSSPRFAVDKVEMCHRDGRTSVVRLRVSVCLSVFLSVCLSVCVQMHISQHL